MKAIHPEQLPSNFDKLILVTSSSPTRPLLFPMPKLLLNNKHQHHIRESHVSCTTTLMPCKKKNKTLYADRPVKHGNEGICCKRRWWSLLKEPLRLPSPQMFHSFWLTYTGVKMSRMDGFVLIRSPFFTVSIDSFAINRQKELNAFVNVT